MEAVRLGLLSTARINDAILAGAAQTDLVEVVAVASRDGSRAGEYAHSRTIPRAHGSYEALLADPELDAVYVSLPNSLHVDWSVRALEAGKHVLCEKPLTRRPDDVERAFEVAERAGLVLMEAFMYRHHPQTKRLAELVAGGAIGELRALSSSFGFLLDRPGDVRLLPELEGGALMDVGCYCVSGLRLLGGEPETVSAEQVVGPSGVDVRLAGLLRFPGGVLGHFHCHFDAAADRSLLTVGTEAVARVADPWGCSEAAVELWRGDEVERIGVEDVDRYRAQLDNFSRAIRGEEEPLLGRADALGQARAIEALYRAAASGEAVAVSSG